MVLTSPFLPIFTWILNESTHLNIDFYCFYFGFKYIFYVVKNLEYWSRRLLYIYRILWQTMLDDDDFHNFKKSSYKRNVNLFS